MISFFESYIHRLKSLIDHVSFSDVEKTLDCLMSAEKRGSNIWVIGNGGSAATASNLSFNLGMKLFSFNGMRFKTQSLSDNTADLTYISDVDCFQNNYSLQLDLKAEKNDVVIAISCSGNSPNIVSAIETAKRKKLTIIGLSGFSGGKLRTMSDINFHIPSEVNEYGIVEDIHMIVTDLIYSYFEQEDHGSVEQFVIDYKTQLFSRLDEIEMDNVIKIANLLISMHKSTRKIFFLGNAGSAEVASHMVNDFGVGLKRRNILNINALSLADNTSVMTAAGNDIGYENTFNMQLQGFVASQDVLFCISSCHMSENIMNAIDCAKKVGATIITCTGVLSADLRLRGDISIHVKTEKYDYGITQDIHMILDHMLYTYYVDVYGVKHD